MIFLLPEIALVVLVLLAAAGGHYVFNLLFSVKWLIEATIVIGAGALLFHAAWLWENRAIRKMMWNQRGRSDA